MTAVEQSTRGMRLRILTLTSLFPNNVNPVRGVFIKERIRYIARAHQVRVVAPVPYAPKLKLYKPWHEYSRVKFRQQIENLEVYHPRYFLIPKVGMIFHGICYFASLLHFMHKLVRVYPFDILDAHYIYPDGFAAVLLAKVIHKPVVLSARGTDINEFMDFPLTGRWILYALKKCNRIITVSSALKERIAQRGIDARKIAVIPNGVDADTFRPVSRAQARTRLGLPDGATILLSVGSLRPSKGFQYLLKAVAEIRSLRRGQDLRLCIVGYGQYRESLQRQIYRLELESCVQLVGRVPPEQMYHWYNAADLFCLASSMEGWPNVILEALACGLPVVATDVGGVPEILLSQDYGLLLTAHRGPELVEQLKRSVLTALEKEWDRDKIVAYAQQRSWNKVDRQVQDVFWETLRG